MNIIQKYIFFCLKDIFNNTVNYKNKTLDYQGFIFMFAERKGFEPSIRLHVYMLSRHAPSTARPPL